MLDEAWKYHELPRDEWFTAGVLTAAAEDDLDARPSHHDNEDDHEHDDFDSFVVELPELASPDILTDRIETLFAQHDVPPGQHPPDPGRHGAARARGTGRALSCSLAASHSSTCHDSLILPSVT